MSTTEGKQTRKPVINDIKSKKKREEQEGLNNLTLKSRKKGSKRNDQYFQNGKICHVQEHLSWLIIVVLTNSYQVRIFHFQFILVAFHLILM